MSLQEAPLRPTTTKLMQDYPTGEQTFQNIIEKRLRVSALLRRPDSGLLLIAGPCSINLGDEATLQAENDNLTALSDEGREVEILQRRNPWKPRTRDEDWHGLETSDPDGAYRRVRDGAVQAANMAAELKNKRHVERYGELLTFGWVGARNDDPIDRIAVVTTDSALPIGIKNNNVTGDPESAIENITRLQELRSADDAPIVLVYRGGDMIQTPDAWEERVRQAYTLTDGRMILDVAHGGEQAHDPEHKFKKSEEGQLACLKHAIELAEDGILPAGYLIEASDMASETDPNLPMHVAMGALRQLIAVCERNLVAV